jgi:N-acyl homoserine lactone hydrolase
MSEASKSAVELDVLLTGEIPMPYAYVFRPKGGTRLTRLGAAFNPRGKMVRSPCLAYVLRHPAAGVILIDTGFHPDAGDNPRRHFGLRMALLFRHFKPAEMSYEEQLAALGVERSEVELVLMTHLHFDHTSGMSLLPNASFACTHAEWTEANGRGAASRGYVSAHLPAQSRMEFIEFEQAGEPHGAFTKTIDLLDDGSIRLISTPGHTPGHMSVLVRVSGGQQVLVVGDAAYTLRSIREEILPLLTRNDSIYLRSLHQLKAFSEQEPGATLVPSHDPTAWHALRDLSASARTGLGAAS